MKTFEQILEEKFIETREFCGRGITKDNIEDMFVPWCEDLDPQEFIDFAERWGCEMKAEILKDVEELSKILQQ